LTPGVRGAIINAVRLDAVAQLVPWVALVVWWFAVLNFRRGRAWLRSTPVVVALLVTTLCADGSAVVATSRMTPSRGHGLATALLWVACLLSITTFLVLRVADDGGDDGGRPDDEPPEPPWWPEFERGFRDYERRGGRPRRAPRPKEPAART